MATRRCLTDWAAVYAREDLQAPAEPLVVITTNRLSDHQGDAFELILSPDEARSLAAKLRKHANFLDPPRPQKRRRV